MIENPMIQSLNEIPALAMSLPAIVTGSFQQSDPYGLIMAVMGMSIVFTALLLTYIIFSNTPALFRPAFRQKFIDGFWRLFKKQEAGMKEPAVMPDSSYELSGEVNAAIAAAIHLYRSELHDFEDTVLTIKKVSRTYSPWSSKIYGVQNNLNKN